MIYGFYPLAAARLSTSCESLAKIRPPICRFASLPVSQLASLPVGQFASSPQCVQIGSLGDSGRHGKNNAEKFRRAERVVTRSGSPRTFHFHIDSPALRRKLRVLALSVSRTILYYDPFYNVEKQQYKLVISLRKLY